MRSGLAALLGQAVDQVDADRAETGVARGLHDGHRFRFRLDAVDGFLHVGVEILHAQADAVEALRAQRKHAFARHRARVDLDRIFAVFIGGELEMLAQMQHQLIHLLFAQVSGRAAAEMQLFDLVHAGKQLALHGDFLLQVAEVGSRLAAVFRDDFVAGAVVTQGVAERHVHVQRQRTAAAAHAQRGQRFEKIAVAEVGSETVGRRIGRVAGAGLAHLADDDRVEFDDGVQVGGSTAE